jgi:hypothetical protein
LLETVLPERYNLLVVVFCAGASSGEGTMSRSANNNKKHRIAEPVLGP